MFEAHVKLGNLVSLTCQISSFISFAPVSAGLKRGYGILKYGDVHENVNFWEIQE